MAPMTRNTTNLGPLVIKLVWLDNYKDEQATLLQRLARSGVTEITLPTQHDTAQGRSDPRLVSRGAFRNDLRRSLRLKALGAQIWDLWIILPREGGEGEGGGGEGRGRGRPAAVPQTLRLGDERWPGLQARLRRLPSDWSATCWYTLRDLAEGEALFEDE